MAELANRLVAKYQDPRLPRKYYSRHLLFSPEARTTFVEPDLREFDLLENSANIAAQAGGFAMTQFA